MPLSSPQTVTGRLLALGVDLLLLVAFAVAGRQSHEPGDAVTVVLAIVWPYAVAALVAHGVLAALHRRSDTVRGGGLAVLVATYVLGMALRAMSGRGLATGFLVVAAVFLTVTLVGWRALSGVVRRRRA